MASVNSAFSTILLDEYADRRIGPVEWVIRKVQGKPTDLRHTAILSKIRQIAGNTKEASIIVFSPPAINGMK